MRLYRASRRDLFERLDQPALRALPAETFVYSEWKVGARVNIDYHIELHGHYYSVPSALIHEHVDARLTATTVDIFHRGQRIAAHLRSHVRGRHTTDPAHMPKAHQRHLEWTPSRLTTWARTIGPQTAALVQAILADRPHPEQGYRSCLGLLRLAKGYGPDRLEAASTRAVAVGGALLSPRRLAAQARPRPPRRAGGVTAAHPHACPRTSPWAGLLPVKERRCSLRPRSRNSTRSSSVPWRQRGRSSSTRPT